MARQDKAAIGGAERDYTMLLSNWEVQFEIRILISLTHQGVSGRIPGRGQCPHRLGDQDAALSRLKPGFESLWGHTSTPKVVHNLWGFFISCGMIKGFRAVTFLYP